MRSDFSLTLSELVCKFYIDFCIEKADRVPRGLNTGARSSMKK